MGARGWHRGGQPTQQRQWIEIDRRGAVGESSLERNADEPVLESAHSILCKGRAQHVFAQGLASTRVLARSRRCRVHRKAVLAGGKAGDGARTAIGQGDGGTLPLLGPCGRVAGDGGGSERGELRLALREAVIGEA